MLLTLRVGFRTGPGTTGQWICNTRNTAVQDPDAQDEQPAAVLVLVLVRCSPKQGRHIQGLDSLATAALSVRHPLSHDDDSRSAGDGSCNYAGSATVQWHGHPVLDAVAEDSQLRVPYFCCDEEVLSLHNSILHHRLAFNSMLGWGGQCVMSCRDELALTARATARPTSGSVPYSSAVSIACASLEHSLVMT